VVAVVVMVTVTWLDDGCSCGGCIIEVAAVVLRCIVVAVWCGSGSCSRMA
jgi:hypothetical protein